MDRKALSLKFRHEIEETTERSLFKFGLDPYDFDIKYPQNQEDNDSSVFVHIHHKDYGDTIYLRGESENLEDARFYMGPGKVLTEEQIVGKIAYVMQAIDTWTNYVQAELIALNFRKRKSNAHTIRDSIKPHLQKCIRDKDDYFTKKEVDEIAMRMENLEKQLAEYKEKLDLTTQNLEDLHKVIDEIKDLAESELQGKWLDKTLSKFSQWASRLEKVEKIAKAVEKGSDWVSSISLPL